MLTSGGRAGPVQEMWNSQVLNDDRPSKRSTPRTTASHVSCTTSSATERLATTVPASRSSLDWYMPTSREGVLLARAKTGHQLAFVAHCQNANRPPRVDDRVHAVRSCVAARALRPARSGEPPTPLRVDGGRPSL